MNEGYLIKPRREFDLMKDGKFNKYVKNTNFTDTEQNSIRRTYMRLLYGSKFKFVFLRVLFDKFKINLYLYTHFQHILTFILINAPI